MASILLLGCFVLLGTGVAEYWHDLEHEREDVAVAARAKEAGMPEPEPVRHDESNCVIHAQLHTPLVSVAWVLLLVCLGLLVAFLSEIAPALVSYRFSLRLDCRGPPAC